MQIESGAKAATTLTVQYADLATSLGSGDVPVLGTPRLVALCEAATVAAVAPHLEAGETTVGTRVEVRHMSPSPIGARVEATAELVDAEGGRLTFAVEAAEENRLIAEGFIERQVIDRQRFLDRLEIER